MRLRIQNLPAVVGGVVVGGGVVVVAGGVVVVLMHWVHSTRSPLDTDNLIRVIPPTISELTRMWLQEHRRCMCVFDPT